MHKNCGEDEEKNVCAMQIHYILKQYNGYNGFLGFVVYAAEHDLLGIRICVVRCTGYIVRWIAFFGSQQNIIVNNFIWHNVPHNEHPHQWQ